MTCEIHIPPRADFNGQLCLINMAVKAFVPQKGWSNPQY